MTFVVVVDVVGVTGDGVCVYSCSIERAITIFFFVQWILRIEKYSMESCNTVSLLRRNTLQCIYTHTLTVTAIFFLSIFATKEWKWMRNGLGDPRNDSSVSHFFEMVLFRAFLFFFFFIGEWCQRIYRNVYSALSENVRYRRGQRRRRVLVARLAVATALWWRGVALTFRPLILLFMNSMRSVVVVVVVVSCLHVHSDVSRVLINSNILRSSFSRIISLVVLAF